MVFVKLLIKAVIFLEFHFIDFLKQISVFVASSIPIKIINSCSLSKCFLFLYFYNV